MCRMEYFRLALFNVFQDFGIYWDARSPLPKVHETFACRFPAYIDVKVTSNSELDKRTDHFPVVILYLYIMQ